MANPFNFYNPYQPYQPRPQGYSGQIIQVNGKAGAEALQMEPNSSVYVQDTSQGNRIYLCMTDGAGYKTVRGILGVFEEEQKETEQKNALQSIEERLKNVEAKLDEYATGIRGGSTTGEIRTNQKHDADDPAVR